MSRYTVTLLHDVSEGIEVEADTPEEAVALAQEQTQGSLCWHCSQHLDIGDIYGEIVADEDGNEVLDTRKGSQP